MKVILDAKINNSQAIVIVTCSALVSADGLAVTVHSYTTPFSLLPVCIVNGLLLE